MNSERLLNTFLDLVTTSSPSGHEGAAAEYCAAALRACGCTVEIDDAGEHIGSDTGNLYAVLPGTASGSVIMTAHLDCVQPCERVTPVIEDGVIRSDGTTVLGGDDKVGVASIIEAVRTLSEGDEPHATVKVIFSIQEEVGCCGAKNLSVGAFEQGEPCYVFDGEGDVGLACLAAPYHYTFEAEFMGKASHAGVAPEKGISAIEAASVAIADIRAHGLLGAVGDYCAANIGTVRGGTANNVVAPSCMLTGECRAIEKEDVDRVHDGLDEAMRSAAAQTGARVRIDWNLEYSGFCLDADAPAVKLFNDAARSVGLSPDTVKSAGGTDANMYIELGVEPLVVSTGMTNFHSVNECLKVEDLEDTARLAVALGLQAAKR